MMLRAPFADTPVAFAVLAHAVRAGHPHPYRLSETGQRFAWPEDAPIVSRVAATPITLARELELLNRLERV